MPAFSASRLRLSSPQGTCPYVGYPSAGTGCVDLAYRLRHPQRPVSGRGAADQRARLQVARQAVARRAVERPLVPERERVQELRPGARARAAEAEVLAPDREEQVREGRAAAVVVGPRAERGQGAPGREGPGQAERGREGLGAAAQDQAVLRVAPEGRVPGGRAAAVAEEQVRAARAREAVEEQAAAARVPVVVEEQAAAPDREVPAPAALVPVAVQVAPVQAARVPVVVEGQAAAPAQVVQVQAAPAQAAPVQVAPVQAAPVQAARAEEAPCPP